MKEEFEVTDYPGYVDGQDVPEGEWTPIECFRCGVCCTGYNPQVVDEEIELMARHLSISVDEFISRYVSVTQIGYLLRQTEKGCVFLTREKDALKTSCSIYPFRPAVCRDLVPSLSRRQCREGLARIKKKGS